MERLMEKNMQDQWKVRQGLGRLGIMDYMGIQ